MKECLFDILNRLLKEAGYYHPEENGITEYWEEEIRKASDL